MQSSFSTIACCIELTENNADIVSYTREMAELTGAKILLVHVIPSVNGFSGYGVKKELLQKVADESRADAEKHVMKFAAQHFKGLACEPLLLTGKVEDALTDLVDRACADLILMGSPNSRRLFSCGARASARLIGRGRIPVMIIPNDLSLECTPDENF
ncbi:MAG: universal stress protein [Mailhella sp.]|nr:universal stress protein [Mailhella sp.]